MLLKLVFSWGMWRVWIDREREREWPIWMFLMLRSGEFWEPNRWFVGLIVVYGWIGGDSSGWFEGSEWRDWRWLVHIWGCFWVCRESLRCWMRFQKINLEVREVFFFFFWVFPNLNLERRRTTERTKVRYPFSLSVSSVSFTLLRLAAGKTEPEGKINLVSRKRKGSPKEILVFWIPNNEKKKKI